MHRHHPIAIFIERSVVTSDHTIKLSRIQLYKKQQGNPMKSHFCLDTVPHPLSKYTCVYMLNFIMGILRKETETLSMKLQWCYIEREWMGEAMNEKKVK